MDLKGKKIVLGSGSPRRREILAGLDIDFKIDTDNNFEESYSTDTRHDRIPVLMAEGKSQGFHRPLEEDEILVTADTMVLCGDEILGKPRSREDAVRMLKLLSGRKHSVITAVTMRDTHRSETFTDTAYVHYENLTDEEIEYYVDKYRPYDKAGAYAIQEWIGHAGIRRIDGSFYTIMGLPAHLVYRKLKDFIG